MDVILAVLADAANSTENGKLNLLGVFQTVFSAEAPVRYPLFNIVMTIRADSSEKGTNHSVGFALTDDESRDVYKNEPLQFDVPVGTKTPYTELSFIFVITDLILPKFGFYQFQVVIDGRIVRQIDLILQPLILPREG